VLVSKASATRNALKGRDPFPSDQDQALANLIAASDALDDATRKADLEVRRTGAEGPAADARRSAMNTLISLIGDYCDRYDRSDIDAVEEKEPDMEALIATANNMSPKEYRKHWRGTSEEERRKSSENGGPGQFLYSLSEADVMAMQLETLRNPDSVGREGGGTVHAFKTYSKAIGWANGKEAFTLRAELTGPKANKSIHSHPR
jgi:hypothetical protein